MNTLPLAIVTALAGAILLGFAVGIMTNLKIDPPWALLAAPFLFAAMIVGGWVAVQYR